MAKININGDIIPNDDKWIYDWFDFDSTCPNDVRAALEEKPESEKLTVQINSRGGSVLAGQEIYSLLLGRKDVEIEIQSMAGSAASVIAMANKSSMSPLAMIMIHNVSVVGAAGDYHDMKKNAEILQQMDAALAAAYVAKTGKEESEILKLMDKETWLTANQALEMGFVDEIRQNATEFTNSVVFGTRLTDELRQKAVEARAEAERIEAEKKNLLDDLDSYGI